MAENNYIATISIGNTNKSLSLEDYQGKLSLVSTWESNSGTKANWCFRQERKDGKNIPGDAMPIKLALGDKEQAIAILTQLLTALGGSPSGKHEEDPFG